MLEQGTVLSGQKISSAINLIKEDFIKRNFHDINVSYTIESIDLESNKKSLAIGIVLQPKSHTLSETEIETVSKKVIDSVSKQTGGVLRR